MDKKRQKSTLQNNYLKIAGNIHLSYFVEAADQLNIEYEIIEKGLLAKFIYNNKHWYIANTVTPLVNTPSSTIAKRKSLTNKVLSKFDIPVPKQFVVSNPQEAIEKYLMLKNIVIKPLQALGGHGVSILPGLRKVLEKPADLTVSSTLTNQIGEQSQSILPGSIKGNGEILGGSITSENITISPEILSSKPALQDVQEAYQFAVDNNHAKVPTEVLVEQFIQGENYRLLVLDNRVIAIVHRVPAYVIGDGTSTIQQLIDAKNILRSERLLLPIPIDVETISKLQTLRYNLQSVIDKDKKIFLRYNANLTTGGTTEECADITHPYYIDLAIKAVKAIGLKYGGVDLITPDITKPTECAINEINYNPGLRLHYKPDAGNIIKVAIPIMEYIRDHDI